MLYGLLRNGDTHETFDYFYVTWESNAHWCTEKLFFVVMGTRQMTVEEFKAALKAGLNDFLQSNPDYELPDRMEGIYGWDMLEEEDMDINPYLKKHGVSSVLGLPKKGDNCGYLYADPDEVLI